MNHRRLKLGKSLWKRLVIKICLCLFVFLLWPLFLFIFINNPSNKLISIAENYNSSSSSSSSYQKEDGKISTKIYRRVPRQQLMEMAAKKRFKPVIPRLLPVVKTQLPKCKRDKLKGAVPVTYNATLFEETFEKNPAIQPGGKFHPNDCEQLFDFGKVAIIIPYRNRLKHLQALLYHLHPILIRQELNYQIFVVEQWGEDDFNKGLLMNVGFKEALKEQNFDCFIFHDVDLFVENDQGIYQCQQLPFHLSEFIDKFRYGKTTFSYTDVVFGGVVAIPRRIFEFVNGYSNIFIGWGGEDDEMRNRMNIKGIEIVKPVDYTSYRFKMRHHPRDEMNQDNQFRFQLLSNTAKRMDHDGLNTLKYRIIDKKYEQIFTHLLVEYSKEEIFDETFHLKIPQHEQTSDFVLVNKY